FLGDRAKREPARLATRRETRRQQDEYSGRAAVRHRAGQDPQTKFVLRNLPSANFFDPRRRIGTGDEPGGGLAERAGRVFQMENNWIQSAGKNCWMRSSKVAASALARPSTKNGGPQSLPSDDQAARVPSASMRLTSGRAACFKCNNPRLSSQALLPSAQRATFRVKPELRGNRAASNFLRRRGSASGSSCNQVRRNEFSSRVMVYQLPLTFLSASAPLGAQKTSSNLIRTFRVGTASGGSNIRCAYA